MVSSRRERAAGWDDLRLRPQVVGSPHLREHVSDDASIVILRDEQQLRRRIETLAALAFPRPTAAPGQGNRVRHPATAAGTAPHRLGLTWGQDIMW